MKLFEIEPNSAEFANPSLIFLSSTREYLEFCIKEISIGYSISNRKNEEMFVMRYRNRYLSGSQFMNSINGRSFE